MSKQYCKKISIWLFCCFLVSEVNFCYASSELKIFHVKIDNAYQNWGRLRIANVIDYDSLNAEGIPQNVKITKQFKLLSLKFGLSDGKEGLYRYKLVGLDNRWSKISSKNEVSYFALTPGQYIFMVQFIENGTVKNQLKFNIELLESFDNNIIINIVSFLFYLLVFSVFYNFRTARLKRTQKILEQTVKTRTAEIVLQKDEISLQKHIVEEKHREISDSINYAKRIQSALLTSQEYWDAISADNFVIWRPKDVVSGDFHWAYQITIGSKHLMTSQEIAVWCAADCTGHGVPGAFMSMLGMSFLNEIVIENVNLKPADILNKLRKKIINALEHGGTGQIEQKDGMDMALCVWHKNTNILEYAGANNPVWIMRPIKDTRAHEIIELKANRMPVGYHYDTKDFTDLKFQLQKGDAIYMFTDGFVDQFGGPDGKKYKSKKFKEMLLSIQHLCMKDQALMINKEFNDWRGNNEQIDDLCLVGVKVV
jgi:serine phosphatase RsbU (regulator of sigma subunit)